MRVLEYHIYSNTIRVWLNTFFWEIWLKQQQRIGHSPPPPYALPLPALTPAESPVRKHTEACGSLVQHLSQFASASDQRLHSIFCSKYSSLSTRLWLVKSCLLHLNNMPSIPSMKQRWSHPSTLLREWKCTDTESVLWSQPVTYFSRMGKCHFANRNVLFTVRSTVPKEPCQH